MEIRTARWNEVTTKVPSVGPVPRETNSGLLSNKESQTQYDTPSSFSTVTSDNEGSDKGETYTDSLTSQTTVSDSTGTKSSFSSSVSIAQNLPQDINTSKPTPDSTTESQIGSSSKSYFEGTDQSEMTRDGVFIPKDESQIEELEEPHASPEPRITRSTRVQHPLRYSTVYTFGVTIPNALGQMW